MAVVVPLVFAMSVTSSFILPRCPPGTYLEPTVPGRQENCLPCPPGQFQSQANRDGRCRELRVCDRSETKLFQGNATMDTICTCHKGGRVYHDDVHKYAFDCLPCELGLTPRPVLNGLDLGDMGCCAATEDAYRDEHRQLICSSKQAPAASARPSTASTHDRPLPTEGRGYAAYASGFFFLGVVCSLAIVGIIFFVWKRRNSRTGHASFYRPASSDNL